MVKDAVETDVDRPAEPARTANALLKRAEQLKRWEESETNKESGALKPILSRKVKFPEGCVFLAACASGDIDEVEHLLEKGADINTTNVDGLTALHQAVIDQNLDMVQFLIDNNADIDAQDNEGWTPLMAGISCNFLDVVRFLLDKNADPALLNNDGELPVDLAETDEMKSVIESEIRRRGINLEEARHREEQYMLRDAIEWASLPNITRERKHPKTGATPLHVAAAKGYIKVMGIFLQAGADVNAKDFDGWTPLHAAAHWGEREACELLVEHMANMDEQNLLGQTCYVVADSDMVPFLESLKKKQDAMKEKRPSAERSSESGLNHTIIPYKQRKNSVTRTSTGDKMKITKSDEVKEAEVLRASSSEASDNDEENIEEEEEEKMQPTFERKRSDVGQADVDNEPPKIPKLETTNGVSVSRSTETTSKSKDDASEKTQTIIYVPTESTSMNVTSVAPFPVASVSVTVQQPLTAGRSMTVLSAAKNENSKVSALQKNFGPPIIIPSEPPQPPSWRLTGRRISSSGVISPPQSPTIVPIQSSNSANNNSSAAPSPSSLSSVSASTPSSSSVSMSTMSVTPPSMSASDAVRWRKQSDASDNSVLDEKNVVNVRPKFPWLRSSSAPAVRSVGVTSPTFATGLRKPSTLNLLPDNNDSNLKNLPATKHNSVAAVFFDESPSTPIVSSTIKSPLSPPFSFVTGERESRKPTITTPLSLAKQQQQRPSTTTTIKQPTAVVHSPLTATNFSPPVRVGNTIFAFGSTTTPTPPNLTPIMENVATRSFTPPQRAEESEAERKARAKRERETRRSTQGITLETVKAAEQLFSERKKTSDELASPLKEKEKAPIKTSAAVFEITNSAKIDDKSAAPRPKVWMKPFDTSSAALTMKPSDASKTSSANNNSTTSNESAPTNVVVGSLSLLTKNLNSPSPYPWRTTRIQIGDSNQSAQPLRPVQPEDQRLQSDKESSDKSPSSSSSVLNRRRNRPNRRSTGPIAQEDVQLAIENDYETDENDTTTTPGAAPNEPTTNTISSLSTNLSSIVGRYTTPSADDNQNDKKSTHTSSYLSSNYDSSNLSGYRNNRYPLTKVGSNLSDRSSRTSSGLSVGGTAGSQEVEVDYKKLYEKEKSENDRLRDVIKDLEKSLENMKLSPKQASGDGVHIIGYDTRLERRVVELEEEKKTLEQVKADNQRLKEENGALIRVISKLSKSK